MRSNNLQFRDVLWVSLLSGALHHHALFPLLWPFKCSCASTLIGLLVQGRDCFMSVEWSVYVVVLWGVEFARFGKKFGMRRAGVLEWWWAARGKWEGCVSDWCWWWSFDGFWNVCAGEELARVGWFGCFWNDCKEVYGLIWRRCCSGGVSVECVCSRMGRFGRECKRRLGRVSRLGNVILWAFRGASGAYMRKCLHGKEEVESARALGF